MNMMNDPLSELERIDVITKELLLKEFISEMATRGFEHCPDYVLNKLLILMR